MNKTTLEKNEIDEIIELLIEYKKLIAIVTVATLFVAILYAFVIYKPIYQATALLQLAKKNTFILEEADALREKLVSKYHIYTDPNQPLPHISNIQKPKYSSGFLEITALAYNKSELKEILTKSVAQIQQEHNISIESYSLDQKSVLRQSNANIESINRQIDALKAKNETLTNQLKELNNEQLALIAINTVTIIKNETEMIRLEEVALRQSNYSNSLEITLNPTRTFNTKLIDGINIHPKPITPSKKIIIIVGFVSGLLLGLLLSFFLASLGKRRE